MGLSHHHGADDFRFLSEFDWGCLAECFSAQKNHCDPAGSWFEPFSDSTIIYDSRLFAGGHWDFIRPCARFVHCVRTESISLGVIRSPNLFFGKTSGQCGTIHHFHHCLGQSLTSMANLLDCCGESSDDPNS